MTNPGTLGGCVDERLRAASFNIRTGWAWDGAHSWPLRSRACAATLEALNADVVGLQEVHGFQQCTLLRRLRGYAAAGAGRDDGRRRGERCSVLFRPARLDLEAWTVRWFSPTPWVPGSRGWGNPITRTVTLCRFLDRVSKQRFGVANAHWDGASATMRSRSAEALLAWLDPVLPWIVLGDLNATAGDPAVAHLVAAGLRDTLAHLGERSRGAATHHPWDGSTEGTRIDYVLVTPEWEALDARIAHLRPGGRLPSDHWPVVADLRIAHRAGPEAAGAERV